MVIQHNITAIKAYNDWTRHNKSIAKSLERLSSGYRINSAADDAAGLAIAERMKAQLTMLRQQKRNAMNAISSTQIMEGTQSGVHAMLQRMNELATEAMNGVLSDTDRQRLDEEYQQLIQEIDRVNQSDASATYSLFKHPVTTPAADGEVSAEGKLVVQGGNIEAYLDALDNYLNEIATAAKDGDQEKLLSLGVDSNVATDAEKVQVAVLNFTKENGEKLLNSDPVDGVKQNAQIILEGGNIQVKLLYSNTKDLGLKDTNLLDASSAGQALEAVQKATTIVSRQRSQYGAIQNRLDHTVNMISEMEANLEDALSRILDADMAKEMMNFVKEQALAQASMFVMTYANHQPEQVLQLLKGM